MSVFAAQESIRTGEVIDLRDFREAVVRGDGDTTEVSDSLGVRPLFGAGADDDARNARDDGMRRDVLRDDCAGRDHRARADGDTRQDDRTSTDPGSALDRHRRDLQPGEAHRRAPGGTTWPAVMICAPCATIT